MNERYETGTSVAHRLIGGRWHFLVGPGTSTTLDVVEVHDGFAFGEYYGLDASHSAARARHGEWQMVNLALVLVASDRGAE